MAHVILLLMPFNSRDEVENRLGDPAPLTPQEVRELIPWMNQIGDTGMRRLNAQFTLQHLGAAQIFEQSSSRLTKCLIGLTVVLAVLTIVIAYYSFELAHSEKTAGQSPGSQESQSTAAETPSTKKPLGPWKAKFSIPGSAELPEKSPILKCGFAEPANASFGYIVVTMTNLTDRSYSVRYSIYGYDQDGRRISEGSDELKIEKRETVLRKVFLLSQQSAQGQLGSAFWIQVILED